MKLDHAQHHGQGQELRIITVVHDEIDQDSQKHAEQGHQHTDADGLSPQRRAPHVAEGLVRHTCVDPNAGVVRHGDEQDANQHRDRTRQPMAGINEKEALTHRGPFLSQWKVLPGRGRRFRASVSFLLDTWCKEVLD